MKKLKPIFQADLFFCIWREQIESIYGWHHERVYVDAWNMGLTSGKDFFDNYVYSPI